MEWINLHHSVLNSEEFIDSEPTERATWFCLLGYCCIIETGGIIEGAKQWKDRKCQQMLKVTREELDSDTLLWEWDGDDLVVAFYPIEQEKKIMGKRKAGKIGGLRSGETKSDAAKRREEAKNKQSTSKPQADSTSKPQAKDNVTVTVTGTGRESVTERKDRAGSLKELSDFCLSLDLITEDAEYLWDHWEANDWKIKNKAIRDWKVTVRNWKRQGYLPSQKNPDLRASSTSSKAPPYAHREKDINGSVMVGSEKDGWTIRWGQLINFMHGSEWPAGEPDEETKERYRKMTGREPNMNPFPEIK